MDSKEFLMALIAKDSLDDMQEDTPDDEVEDTLYKIGMTSFAIASKVAEGFKGASEGGYTIKDVLNSFSKSKTN